MLSELTVWPLDLFKRDLYSTLGRLATSEHMFSEGKNKTRNQNVTTFHLGYFIVYTRVASRLGASSINTVLASYAQDYIWETS